MLGGVTEFEQLDGDPAKGQLLAVQLRGAARRGTKGKVRSTSKNGVSPSAQLRLVPIVLKKYF